MNNIDVLHLAKFQIDNLEKPTIILDDTGAYMQLEKKLEDTFRKGRHPIFQVIILTSFAKNVCYSLQFRYFSWKKFSNHIL